MTFLDRQSDARRFRHWEGDIEADYIYTSGVAGERFFVALRDEGKLLSARCSSCDVRYLPPRLFCERCLGPLGTWAEIPSTGRISAVTVAHVDRKGVPQAQPETFVLVRFKGIHGGLVHRFLAAPETARAGLAVRPRLKPRPARSGAITDIEGFEPVPR